PSDRAAGPGPGADIGGVEAAGAVDLARQGAQRHDLTSVKHRLKALEAKVAHDGIVLTETQIVAIEAHGEFDSECPDYCDARPGYLWHLERPVYQLTTALACPTVLVRSARNRVRKRPVETGFHEFFERSQSS